MKVFKKLLAILLSLACIFVVACGDTPDNGGEGGGEGGGGGGEGGGSNTSAITETDFISKLSSTPFANVDLKDTVYGLSNPANVGVVESKMQECLYPIPSDEEFEGEIIDYATFGESADEPFNKLNAIFARAKELNGQGTKVKVKLPEGPLHVYAGSVSGNFAFVLKDYDGLYLEGNNTDIILSYSGVSWKGFLNVQDSKDIRIEGITFDLDVPSTLVGEVMDSSAEMLTIDLKILPEFNPLIEKLLVNHVNIHSVVEFSSITKAPVQGGNFIAQNGGAKTHIDSYEIEGNSTDGYTMKIKFLPTYRSEFARPARMDYLSVGFSMYVYNTFHFSGCEDVYMENVTVYSAPGMAYVAQKCTNVYFNRTNVMLKPGTSRLMTATADGMHFEGLMGDCFVTNSIIENTHDDALNIKAGYWYKFVDADILDKTIIISRATSSTPMRVGDVLEIYSEDDFTKYATLTITEVSGDAQMYTIKVKESLITLGISNWDAARVTNTSITPDFRFANNIIRNKRNRGILCQVRGAVIENNTFQNVGHGSISIHSSLDVFNEATMPQNIKVRNNKFLSNNILYGFTGDIYVFARANSLAPSGTITGIEIENNFISNCSNAGISLQSVGNSAIRNNLISNPARTSANVLVNCAIEMTNTKDTEIKGNYVVKKNASDEYAGIIVGGMTDVSKIKTEGNTNLAYQVIAGDLVRVDVAKVSTGTFTVDGDVSDWENAGTSIDIVGYSLADGSETDAGTLSKDFEVRLAKIAWTDDGLYIAFDIKDNELAFKSPSNFWTGDCFEMFMTTDLSMPNADLQLIKNTSTTMQIAIVPDWTNQFAFASVRTSADVLESTKSFVIKSVRTADGYTGEAFFPFEAMRDVYPTIESGNGIAMAWVFADSDRTTETSTRTRAQVSNVPHFVEAWKTKTARMPIYYFVQ